MNDRNRELPRANEEVDLPRRRVLGAVAALVGGLTAALGVGEPIATEQAGALAAAKKRKGKQKKKRLTFTWRGRVIQLSVAQGVAEVIVPCEAGEVAVGGGGGTDRRVVILSSHVAGSDLSGRAVRAERVDPSGRFDPFVDVSVVCAK